MYHEQWLAARGTAKAAEWVAKLESAAESFLFAARTDANVERKLKCVLWTVDVAVNGATFDDAAAAKAADLLSKAAPLVSALPASSSAVADYHYKLLQLAKKQDADERVREEADWLAKNAAGSVYEQSALVVLAGDIEQALKNASGDQRQALVQQAKAIYGRFAELVGQTPKVMADVKNARVVNSRLAQYDYELGNHREAADRAVRLLQAFPDDRIYLRLAGLSQYYAGQYETAIEHWRTLVQGLPKNTPAWYEAKYFQLASLVHFDKPNAVEAYKQFVLLYPKVESEPWLSDREGLRRLVAN
jgi:tetratricopeptide (TPR) repeat protein